MRRRHFLISSTALGASILFAENGNAQRAYTCNYVSTSSNGFSLTDSWLNPGPFRTQRVMDFGIDRQSFLDRGWTNSQIGNWNPSNKRKSLFLSAFYALQMNNANDLKHPWNEPSHDWDRGLGAHIDFWSKHVTGKPFYLYIYDSLQAPNLVGRIVGRRTSESPFNGNSSILGNAPGANGEIFINTDADFALGERMDVNSWVGAKINLSHVIAHEAGHWFGFDHVSNCPQCMLNPSLGGSFVPRWQYKNEVMNSLFTELARKLA
jgi:Matrixin